MILKASQRGGAKQLAIHLQRTDDNEHVEIHEVRGFISDDLTEAMKEAYAISRGTRCKQFLFSVSLNPPETENVGIDTFENAIDRIEAKNGLNDQPRIVVFHEKEGRRHAHAVWSRIDAETMTAKNLPHFKLKLRDISRELYLENDWKMPRGLMNSAERDPRNFSLTEWQQAKRMGHNARDLKAMMQECWAVSDSRAAFSKALQERGLILAKGDRRAHVAVTHEGEVLAVARYTGKKTKDVEARLGKPDGLPSVDEANGQHAKDLRQRFKRHVAEAKEQKRRALEPLEARRKMVSRQHREERKRLEQKQQERWTRETRDRAARLHSGMRGIWQRLSGEYTKIRQTDKHETYTAFQRDRQQREALTFSQLIERRDLQRQIHAVRQRHATLFKEIRQEKPSAFQSRQPASKDLLGTLRRTSTKPDNRRAPADRLKELRGDSSTKGYQRNKPPERDR